MYYKIKSNLVFSGPITVSIICNPGDSYNILNIIVQYNFEILSISFSATYILSLHSTNVATCYFENRVVTTNIKDATSDIKYCIFKYIDFIGNQTQKKKLYQ